MSGKIVPALATQWAPSDDGNVWRFTLRKGVRFHDGADFTAEDVVASFRRAMIPDSDMKELLASIKDIEAVDDHKIHIVTDGPNPILPSNLTDLFIMDRGWTEKHGVQKPQDFENGEETWAVRNANGTGAFMLVSREPDSKTVLEQSPDYWGKGRFPLEVTEIVYTPIQNAATRVAALLSGEIDFIQDVPVQDLGRVRRAGGLAVRTAPQNRVIFFGLNQGGKDLESDNIDGRNPFADRRVRQAMNIAINRDAIRKVVMREQSRPAGVIMPPFVNGWTRELDGTPRPAFGQRHGRMSGGPRGPSRSRAAAYELRVQGADDAPRQVCPVTVAGDVVGPDAPFPAGGDECIILRCRHGGARPGQRPVQGPDFRFERGPGKARLAGQPAPALR